MSTTPRIVVVDYGMGNVLSVCRAIERCGGTAHLTANAGEVAKADRLVLPGVGAFGDCMKALAERELVSPVLQFVATGRPFLGICVGMQILHDWGEEFGGAAGLGLIPGRVVQIPTRKPDGDTRKIPHIGWTNVVPPPEAGTSRWADSIFAGSEPPVPLYFVHSFSAAPTDPSHILAIADYQGFPVTAAVHRDNITGTQFHPEKSGPAGLALLKQFMGL
jgi:glutamine amidotransferase